MRVTYCHLLTEVVSLVSLLQSRGGCDRKMDHIGKNIVLAITWHPTLAWIVFKSQVAVLQSMTTEGTGHMNVNLCWGVEVVKSDGYTLVRLGVFPGSGEQCRQMFPIITYIRRRYHLVQLHCLQGWNPGRYRRAATGCGCSGWLGQCLVHQVRPIKIPGTSDLAPPHPHRPTSHHLPRHSCAWSCPATASRVLFDRQLSFRAQIGCLAVRGHQRLGFLRKAYRVLDSSCCTAVYNGFVRPVLEYAMLTWMSVAPTTLAPLSSIQRRALHIIGDGAYLPSLEIRRAIGALCFLYKLHYHDGPDIVTALLPPPAPPLQHCRTRQCSEILARHAFQLECALPRQSRNNVLRSFPDAAVGQWN